MDVQSLLGKLDNLNKEGSVIQEQIKSVDEQLSKTELDINIIQQENERVEKTLTEIQRKDRDELVSIKVSIDREMLCKLDKQIQTEEKEVDDRIQRLDTVVYKNGFLFIRSSFLQTTSDGKNKQEEYHRLTAQRIAQEKERLSTREQELHQQIAIQKKIEKDTASEIEAERREVQKIIAMVQSMKLSLCGWYHYY
ncbi:uncharacterized protein [Blastocystis hominis]|uniref:Uncharacterized protein n=1 Tax=Blastocystis hominis TaxID=12968 RepID=D8M8F5_BLAHO|nr:uncharacterized protein [Blastocystis hominis]CBK24344.2 unnamed protein product [Blastocystis hominis]|eukprot:XP_012898392.1 uncharacterized protein [Blastocystis hominis]